MASDPPIGPTFTAGTLLRDTYVIQERLAAGGMGEVYRATHVRLPGPLAIKVLAPHLAKDPAAVARFCREAAIASVLRHPHIVQISDFHGGTGGLPFLVMELLNGRDLAEHLVARGPLSLDRVVRVLAQVASALEAAHALGIVHRDLKPANVMLVDYDGLTDFVKVLDFGVSRIAGVEPAAVGAVLGTPSYMAPEQAEGRGDQADPRTDQFALAVLGYVLLTGATPFPGRTTAEVLQRIIFSEATRLPAALAWRSSAVELVLDRALAKRASARFARVTDFARALAEAAGTVPEVDRCRAPSWLGPPPPLTFQGQPVGQRSETSIRTTSYSGRGASSGRSRPEDVTLDARTGLVGASIEEVA